VRNSIEFSLDFAKKYAVFERSSMAPLLLIIIIIIVIIIIIIIITYVALKL